MSTRCYRGMEVEDGKENQCVTHANKFRQLVLLLSCIGIAHEVQVTILQLNINRPCYNNQTCKFGVTHAYLKYKM